MPQFAVLLAIEAVLVPVCTALIGTRVGAPLAALALCVPQIVAATWLLGARAGVLLTACAAAGWFLPSLLGGAPPVAHVDLSAVILSSAVLAGFVLITRQWRDSQERAAAAADRDPLTGLLNRSGFVRRVESEANRSARSRAPLAIAFIDCDHFKQFNDTRGHAAGDQALVAIGTALQENVRNYDSVARLGGDEFAVLFPATDETAARAASARLMQALHDTFGNREWPLTCSMGVAVFASPRSVTAMIAAADAEMYAAKRSGKGRCHVRMIAAADDSVSVTAP